MNPASPPSASEVSIAHIGSVPAGAHAISATLRLTNQTASVSPSVTCFVISTDAIGRASHGQAKTQLGTQPGEAQQVTLAIQEITNLRAVSELSIECGTGTPGATIVSDAAVIAIQVTSVRRTSS